MPAAGPQKATVFVVDDDAGVRDSLRILLEATGHAVRSFGSAFDFLVACDPEAPGCLLLDVNMPAMTGLELQRELGLRRIFLPVIFLTGHADVPTAVDAMKNGAFDFLQKPFGQDALLERVTRALAADHQAREALTRASEIRRREASLTPREREVMALIVRGLANKVIAQDLRLSERTVEIHRARVMEKMGSRSVAHLVRMALALGQ